MTYQPPLQDYRFTLSELAELDDILALPGFAEVTPEVVEAILEEHARLVTQTIAPLNRAGDTAPPVWQDGVVTTTAGFAQAFADYADGGWQGLGHAADAGGQGLPRLVSAAASETMQAANLAFSLCPLLTDGVIEALLMAGSDEQKRSYVPKLMSGQWTGTMNLTEPQAGSDLSLITTRAVPQTDGNHPGSYRLFGQKIFITWGEHDLAENIVHLVLARTPDAPAGIKGLSLFVVPKFLPDAQNKPGVRNDVWCASLEHKLGIHASPTAVLLYGAGKGEVGEGAVGYLVGQEHRGLSYMFIMMNAARYAVGQQGVAISERASQQALAYARERVQSATVDSADGKPAAIIHHPDVQRMLLTMRALTEAGRALAYVAAAANDRAARHPDEAVRAQNKAYYEYLVPVLKGFATEAALEVTTLGVQVHGGMGYIEETGAAQHLRDARILSIYEGTTAIQANDLIGRKTLRDGAAVARACAAQMRQTLAELAAAAQARAGSDAASGAGLSADLSADLSVLHAQLAAGLKAYEAATVYVATQAQQGKLRAAFAGSVPYLMLAGTVHGGWQMARAALACLRRSQAGEQDDFLAQKWATAVFYAAHILPRTAALNAAVQAGEVTARAGSVLAGA